MGLLYEFEDKLVISTAHYAELPSPSQPVYPGISYGVIGRKGHSLFRIRQEKHAEMSL
jgi:hypothetical protein